MRRIGDEMRASRNYLRLLYYGGFIASLVLRCEIMGLGKILYPTESTNGGQTRG